MPQVEAKVPELAPAPLSAVTIADQAEAPITEMAPGSVISPPSRAEPLAPELDNVETVEGTAREPDTDHLAAKWAAARQHRVTANSSAERVAARSETHERSAFSKVKLLPDEPTPQHLQPADVSLAREELAVSSRLPGQRFAMLHTVAKQWRTSSPACRYLVVVGSSAESRKLAPVIRALRAQPGMPERVLVCAAGERPARTREALQLVGVVVDLELEVPVLETSLEETRTRLITGFGRLLTDLKPEWVVVQGNSATTAMASIAAYYANVRVAHVDGGSPAHDHNGQDESDPEVLHRMISALFASVHFADTSTNKEALMREGVPAECVLVTGNTGIDVMHEMCAGLGLSVGTAGVRSSGVVRVLVAVELAETLKSGLPDICRAIRNLATSVPGLYQFVWPLQAEPDGLKTVTTLLDRVSGVLLAGPTNYEQFLRLLSESDLVLTDLEDVQEEAPSLGKPVVLMRQATSRPEALRAGITTLVGTDAASIQAGLRSLARKLSVRHGSITNPYGDGKAALRILDFFEGRQVLEFGRTALPKLLTTNSPRQTRLLAEPSTTS